MLYKQNFKRKHNKVIKVVVRILIRRISLMLRSMQFDFQSPKSNETTRWKKSFLYLRSVHVIKGVGLRVSTCILVKVMDEPHPGR